MYGIRLGEMVDKPVFGVTGTEHSRRLLRTRFRSPERVPHATLVFLK